MNAEEIIKLQERLESADSTLRSRWQDTADYTFPRESDITSTGVSGIRKTDTLYDVTAVLESEGMTSGLLTNLIPAGQAFFSLSTSDSAVAELDAVKSYMAMSTEVLHEALFTSNFILQLTETLRSLISFGTGNLYSEWREGLNFMDWDVSRYQMLENFRGQVDTMILKFPKTARQAYTEWGDKAGKSVVEIFEGASADVKKEQDLFWFIHIVRPRQWRNPRLEDDLNMPFESAYINVKDKVLISESGFDDFPYHVPRWSKTSGEVHGRGIGTMILPQVKILNGMVRDLFEVGNKHANPSREILQSFEGEYDTTPGGRNDVSELPSSHVDERNHGNFPVSKDIVEMQRVIVREAYYSDAWAPMRGLTGDRRNELEIQQRIQEAFRRIGSPIGRIESELFTPLITRCYMLMVRNKAIAEPPEELQGRNLKVIYKGPLSLAQQNAEVRASQQWAGILSDLSQTMGPQVFDHIDEDDFIRRLGRVFGVNEQDIASEEQVAFKREQRQAEEDQQRALEAAQVAAGAYGQTTKAPEAGSAAEQLQNV